jgi:hypothetical protein
MKLTIILEGKVAATVERSRPGSGWLRHAVLTTKLSSTA